MATQHMNPVLIATERILRFESEILRKERFVLILGTDIVDSWEADWDVLENRDICFTDPVKASSMRYVFNHLAFCSRHDASESLSKLYVDCLMMKSDISFFHLIRLEAAALSAFMRHFPGSQIDFAPKCSGVQLGTKARVTLGSGKSRTYHVKTHAAGWLDSNTFATNPVDAGELLVYKILELTGTGCESLFFQNNFVDCYVATLDAGHDGSFDVFCRAAGNRAYACSADEGYGNSLWGCLGTISLDQNLSDWESVEVAAQKDEAAGRFLFNITLLDMITRIFRLRDLLDNYDNFGFVTRTCGHCELKIIDFRLEKDYMLAVSSENFGGFLAGNGLYNIFECHKIMRYALHDRRVSDRVKDALQALESGPLSKLHEHIDSACAFVHEHLQSSEFADQGETQHHLTMHCRLRALQDIFHKNLSLFTASLQSWHI